MEVNTVNIRFFWEDLLERILYVKVPIEGQIDMEKESTSTLANVPLFTDFHGSKIDETEHCAGARKR